MIGVRRQRILFTAALGLLVAAYVTAHGLANPDFTSDFDQVWAGASPHERYADHRRPDDLDLVEAEQERADAEREQLDAERR